MIEDGVSPLVVVLVVHIHTLICPLLSHPGQFIIPDLSTFVTPSDCGNSLSTHHWAHTARLGLVTSSASNLTSHL